MSLSDLADCRTFRKNHTDAAIYQYPYPGASSCSKLRRRFKLLARHDHHRQRPMSVLVVQLGSDTDNYNYPNLVASLTSFVSECGTVPQKCHFGPPKARRTRCAGLAKPCEQYVIHKLFWGAETVRRFGCSPRNCRTCYIVRYTGVLDWAGITAPYFLSNKYCTIRTCYFRDRNFEERSLLLIIFNARCLCKFVSSILFC